MPALLPLREMWAEQREGAATVGAYETMEGRRGSPTLGFQGRTEKEGSAGRGSCPRLTARLVQGLIALTQRARGLGRCRERIPSGWGRAPRVSRVAHPSPTVSSAVDTLPAWGSSGDLSVSGQFCVSPETFSYSWPPTFQLERWGEVSSDVHTSSHISPSFSVSWGPRTNQRGTSRCWY